MTDSATLLVVDDNSTNLSLLFDYLTNDGYHVLVAEDGETAIEQAREALPDIILMDVLLPGISGFDACRVLASDESTRDIPVIFLTALSRTIDKIEGFRAGGVDYLTKPLQFDEVSARVRTHVKIRRLQQELADRNRMLEEANRRKNKAFTIIAHDLKSPISTFVSALRILDTFNEVDAQQADVINGLRVRADRLDKFVDSLLEWAGLELEGGDLEVGEFRLWSAVQQILDLSEPEARAKGITTSVDVAETLTVCQSPQAMRVVLSNLVSNAVKFTSSGGNIRVRAALHDGIVAIEVSDDGMGMDPQETTQLFNLETRLHKPGTAGEKGSGLGLILTTELVERMGGTIHAESTPGAGTTMFVEVPDLRVSDQ